MSQVTDRIEKQLVIKAPINEVWRAISDSKAFGTWFRANFDGKFEAGNKVSAHMTIPGFEHMKFEIVVDRVESEKLFSFRWHPFAIDPSVDYSGEPMTLVEFKLEQDGEATKLSITESGFDKIPESRRDEAFRMNDGGWSAQSQNLASHVSGS